MQKWPFTRFMLELMKNAKYQYRYYWANLLGHIKVYRPYLNQGWSTGPPKLTSENPIFEI